MDLSVAVARSASPTARPIDLLPVRAVAGGIVAVLLGYMFLGRGFAHISVGPIYIGDVALVLGGAVTGYLILSGRARIQISPVVGLLLAFIALGAIRTIPYLGTYGMDALRDGVVWGYAGFALVVVALFDRRSLTAGLRAYSWVVPVFAFWLPISWNLFTAESVGIDPSRPGSFLPLVFFKAGDMTVHIVGCLAALVIVAVAWRSGRTFAWRMIVTLPLLWTMLVAVASNRGALVTLFLGIVVIALLARRTRNWLPLAAATLIFSVAGAFQAMIPSAAAAAPSASASAIPVASAAPGSVALVNPGFEAPAAGQTIPGWTFFGVGRFSAPSSGGREGTAYGRIDGTGGPYTARLSSDQFPVGSGSDIAVSVWASAIASTPTLELYVNWFDARGDMMSSQFVAKLAPVPGQGWQLCQGTLAVPVGAARAQLRLWEAHGTSVLGVDDVSARFGDFAPSPAAPKGRQATIAQIVDNILSVFGSTTNSGLAGSREFRLAWWGTIVDYTVFGQYFWTGKGFGINLANADGFQATADQSLRAPHNTHMTILAREGVPGFALWLALQTVFAVGILGTILRASRSGDRQLVALAGFVFIYWLAMMVDTSFDPYLEGPQGGIWFWTMFGAGVVLIQGAGRAAVRR